MNRRNLLLALAAAGLDLKAQEPAHGSLYIPKPHLVEDRKFLQDFMDEFAFADLVTAAPASASRISRRFWIAARRRTARCSVTSRARTRRANVSTAASRPWSSSAGPDSYISPDLVYQAGMRYPRGTSPWYTPPAGCKPIADPKALHSLLARLIAKFEGSGFRLRFRQTARELH